MEAAAQHRAARLQHGWDSRGTGELHKHWEGTSLRRERPRLFGKRENKLVLNIGHSAW